MTLQGSGQMVIRERANLIAIPAQEHARQLKVRA